MCSNKRVPRYRNALTGSEWEIPNLYGPDCQVKNSRIAYNMPWGFSQVCMIGIWLLVHYHYTHTLEKLVMSYIHHESNILISNDKNFVLTRG